MANKCLFSYNQSTLLDSHRLGQVAREINVETLHDSQPVGNQLQRNDVEETLQAVDSLGNLDLLGLVGCELLIAGVADDNGLATTSSNYCKFISQPKSCRQSRGKNIPCW